MGDLFSSSQGSPVTTTSTTTSPLFPYVQSLINKGPYTGQLSQDTQQAQNLTAQTALQGTPVMNAAQNTLQDLVSGKYLNPQTNPYLQQTYNTAADALTPQINATFSQGGRTGSNAHAEALGKGLSNLSTGVFGGAYNQGLQNMFGGLTVAPSYANQTYNSLGQLANVGAQQDARTLGNYYFPLDILSKLGNLGGQNTSQSTPTQNPSIASDVLGVGLTAASLFSDRRLKSNIVKIGKGRKGLSVYSYEIFGKPDVGFMADEVEKISPWAIGELMGFKTVDYSRV